MFFPVVMWGLSGKVDTRGKSSIKSGNTFTLPYMCIRKHVITIFNDVIPSKMRAWIACAHTPVKRCHSPLELCENLVVQVNL